MRALLTLIVCGGILAAAGWGTQKILSTQPKAQREGATRETAMLVELADVEFGTFQPEIVVLGRVRPEREIELRPQVSGRVLVRHERFTPGGLVREDEILFEIEAADYENVVEQRQSDLDQARADLQVEEGRQKVARRDYEVLREEARAGLDDAQRRLALREPQVEAARVRVKAAEAALAQARLDVERTKIHAPFDAQVLSREADVGSRVSPGDVLGRLVGVHAYWVVASVPLSSLRWIDLRPHGGHGAPARVRNRAAWPEDTFRHGRVLRLVGALEPETRLAPVLVEIPDPLALTEPGEAVGEAVADNGEPGSLAERPPLIIDAIVEVRIRARPIEDVVRLDRDYLRTGNTVWVWEDAKLRIQPVEVVFRDAKYAYVGEGLAPHAKIVTTNLATVIDGAPLRTEAAVATDEAVEPEENGAPASADAGPDTPAEPAPKARDEEGGEGAPDEGAP